MDVVWDDSNVAETIQAAGIVTLKLEAKRLVAMAYCYCLSWQVYNVNETVDQSKVN